MLLMRIQGIILSMFNLKALLGAKIRDLRIARSFTQEGLANKIGISTRSMSFIETGKTFPTADTITKICEVLAVAPHQLFYFENCREIGSIKDELIDKIKKDDEFATFIYKASFNI